ncbi:MAG: LEA type 2 family protein [Idiomarina sp.]|nr:LEA type 2 family protein [Idiomarina sp.]
MNRTRLYQLIALGVFVTLTSSGCSLLRQNIVDNVHYRLQSVDVQVGMRQGTSLLPNLVADVNAALEIRNDSLINLFIERINYDIYLGDTLVASGVTGEGVQLDSGGDSQLINFNIQLSAASLLNEGITLSRTRALPPVRVDGSSSIATRFGVHEVPFSVRYERPQID